MTLICSKCLVRKQTSSFKYSMSSMFYGDRCRDCLRVRSKRCNQFKSAKEYYSSPIGRYSSYKSAAKIRGYGFSITLSQFSAMIGKSCNYCGFNDGLVGVDRKDNTIGYQIDNCVPCCYQCNRMKGKLSVAEFMGHINKILNR